MGRFQEIKSCLVGSEMKGNCLQVTALVDLDVDLKASVNLMSGTAPFLTSV